jgi:hypothetical protein
MYLEGFGVMRNAKNIGNSVGTWAALVVSMPLAPTLMSAEPKPDQPAWDVSPCELNIVGESIEKLTLEDRAGITRQLSHPGPNVSLPAGQYQVTQVELKDGYRWTADGAGEYESFRLAPGEPYQLRVGAPLNPSVKVTRHGRLLNMDYQLLDAAGRNYSGPERSDPPRFTVFKDGRMIGSGSFEYG